jgi:hypothetical protein
MSAAVDTVNAILAMIFRHVQTACPERTEVSVAHDLFESMVASTPRKPMGMFLAAFGPRASLLFAKDPALFDDVSLRDYWDDLPDASQRIVWLALVQVYMLTLAITCLPPEALTAIEETARFFAASVKDGHADVRAITRSIL